MRRLLVIDAVWTACKNYALISGVFYLIKVYFIRLDFGKNVLFTNSPCDELIVLPAEVENENFFMIILHADAFFYLKIISSLLGPFETILTGMPSSFSMKRT